MARLIDEVQQNLNIAWSAETEEDAILSHTLEGFDNEDFVEWFRQSMKFVPGLQEEMDLYSTYVREKESLATECIRISEQAEQEHTRLTELQTSQCGSEVKHAVRYLLEKEDENTVANTYKMTFDK